MEFFKHRWAKPLVFGLIGMSAGYAYYYFIGCTSGSCPLTSNPFITTGYGLGAGLILGWDGKRPVKKKEEEEK
ncbi:MAG TPA: hypothetical protein ENK44_12885 [Caldithrix abyssi]|uniref:YtxH domain-containing protein n=1 Tax=Caldithrix abyssi TaxID=187145 RepID=A0A7V4WWI2_CALAY|nr:hypothetical protein [Caldithrix abyssi]